MIKDENPDKQCILVADDDSDDREMLKAAFDENKLPYNLTFVENGEEAMLYLKRKGRYVDIKSYPLPNLILLDLNMPRKDGREVIREIRNDFGLCGLPIVVLTTSRESKDVLKCYELGCNSFIIKPVTFHGLLLFTNMLHQYWFNLVELPALKKL
ncbi:two-component system response regulator [Chitinophaga caeni]|uniref:Two-component system response regulator n=1 Tax=Chitinophaga caeni TaxID=2029983 RepID=A0A291QR85_9BACT|nr:response regulator [Chitinophaga caeni]ATL46470.1 two-component system response regulator [Chitinophaga caeni]